MRIEIDASGSSDYGDFATVRINFQNGAYIEVDAAEAHNLGPGPSAGAKVSRRGIDVDKPEVVWDGTVISAPYELPKLRG